MIGRRRPGTHRHWDGAAPKPAINASRPEPGLSGTRAVQVTRFGGPEVPDVVDLPGPIPGDGEQLYEVSAVGVNFADIHHRLAHLT
ncbi:hypothetical protein SAMN05661080_01324 [Modestobacter sp. DSM 44400]|uniref:hypothetical protein n=1 Tax=Modestobacter sp. DSM 44400 TaxID=1550230 RepID=UPI000897338F|nr:hypothetical protein [Modestobacter sp. DSM 44400]SDX82258.1 hypothetical protein SAMN05661080_01324 [Modestobacter sp. DSM 44400]